MFESDSGSSQKPIRLFQTKAESPTKAQNQRRKVENHPVLRVGVGGGDGGGVLRRGAPLQGVLPDVRLRRHRPRGPRFGQSQPNESRREPRHQDQIRGRYGGRHEVEFPAAAARNQGASGRNRVGLLHGQESDLETHRRDLNVQRDPVRGRAVLQQDPVFLFRGAKAEPRRGGGHAGLLLHRPGVRRGSFHGEGAHNRPVVHLLRVKTGHAVAQSLR